MALSDAFSKVYGTIRGVGNDAARVQLLGAEMALSAQLAQSDEARRALMFPLQMAAMGANLDYHQTNTDLLREELSQRRQIGPIQLERERLLNKATKAEAAEQYESRWMRQAAGLGGLNKVAAEIEGVKAEAKLREAQAREAQAMADTLAPMADAERSEELSVRDMVDDVFGRAEDLLGTPIPSQTRKLYQSRATRALRSGRYDLEQVHDLLATEVSNGLTEAMNAGSVGQQMATLGGRPYMPGASPSLFGIPAPTGLPAGDPLVAARQREQAALAENLRLQGLNAQSARNKDLARIQEIVSSVAEKGRPARGGVAGEADMTLLTRRLGQKFGIEALSQLEGLPTDALRAIRRDLESIGFGRIR